jgi:hypothetical protein
MRAQTIESCLGRLWINDDGQADRVEVSVDVVEPFERRARGSGAFVLAVCAQF